MINKENKLNNISYENMETFLDTYWTFFWVYICTYVIYFLGNCGLLINLKPLLVFIIGLSGAFGIYYCFIWLMLKGLRLFSSISRIVLLIWHSLGLISGILTIIFPIKTGISINELGNICFNNELPSFNMFMGVYMGLIQIIWAIYVFYNLKKISYKNFNIHFIGEKPNSH
jgi:hypothetical protein